jgi:hypothetical protein
MLLLREHFTFAGVVAGGLLALACVEPRTRLPLPALFPVIGGATPVPGNGVGLSLELADGLRGPELGRGEVHGGGISAGVDDRASLGYLYQETSDAASGVTLHVGVKLWRLKMRVGQLFGVRSAVAVYGAIGSSERARDTLQDDRLRTWELALPAEFLVTEPRASTRASLFVGPRIVFERYEDRVRPDQSFDTVFPGVVGGLHLALGHVELFVESTLAYVPRNSYLGVPSGGRLTVMPALSASVRLGPTFDWSAPP